MLLFLFAERLAAVHPDGGRIQSGSRMPLLGGTYSERRWNVTHPVSRERIESGSNPERDDGPPPQCQTTTRTESHIFLDDCDGPDRHLSSPDENLRTSTSFGLCLPLMSGWKASWV